MGSSGGSVSRYDSRAPITPELAAMQSQLYSQFMPQIKLYGEDWEQARGRAEKYRSDYDDAIARLTGVTEQGVSNDLTRNMNAYLTREMNRSMGTALSKLAGRGIVNSSVTNRAIGDIGTQTADAFAKNYSDMMGRQMAGYQALAGLAQNRKAREWADLMSQYAGLEDFFKTMRHSADTHTIDTVVEQGGK